MPRLAAIARTFAAAAGRTNASTNASASVFPLSHTRSIRGLSSVRVVSATKRSGAAASDKPAADDAKPAATSNGTEASVPADSDLASTLFNPSEGYLQGSHWSTSFQGMATEPFDQRISDVLMAPVAESEVEIKPDGLLYLPEIKYRRILNRAFGPGGWGLVPRGAHSVSGRTLSREYALICLGRFTSQARGEQDYFDEGGLATATEGCKSNALVRCCKDLGVASELWDPAFISMFKSKYCVEEWVTHAVRGTKKRMWRLKTRQWEYPWAKK